MSMKERKMESEMRDENEGVSTTARRYVKNMYCASEQDFINESNKLRECAQGSFSRSIPLPYDANPNSINARIKNGLLKISITKSPENSEKVKKSL